MAGSIAIGATDVLIVVDVQNDFCPGGRLAVPRGDEIVAPINRLAASFAHVVLTQDWHPAGHHSFASALRASRAPAVRDDRGGATVCGLTKIQVHSNASIFQQSSSALAAIWQCRIIDLSIHRPCL